MVRSKFKWKFALFFHFVALNVFTTSLPIDTRPSLVTTESPFVNSELITSTVETSIYATTLENKIDVSETITNETEAASVAVPRNSLLRQVRPGQEVRNYDIELSYEGNEFNGRAIIDIVLTQATRDDPIVFHAEGFNINRLMTGVFTEANAIDADFIMGDGLLEIFPPQPATSYVVIVEYTLPLGSDGVGLYLGEGNDASYIAMNLHPTNARRVFPCMDEPTEASTIRFTFNNIEYTNMIANSMLEDNSQTQFRALQGPAHLWGMVAHNFINLNIPITNVVLTGRPGLASQDSQASLAINSFFNFFNEWTNKPYFEIVVNQAQNLHIIALPDIDVDWHSLSSIGIWEPYLLMETGASVKQRKTVLVKIAESLAKQWFGYVIFPENWRHEWVVSGLATYAAYEAVKSFQSTGAGTDVTLLDMNTLFVTDIIQESLLRDSYISAQPLELDDDIFEEEAIRDHIYGLLKYKAPAVLHMLKYILGDGSDDFIQLAGRALLNGRSLQTVNSLNFIDAVNSYWMAMGSNLLDEFNLDFLEPWIMNTGYPLLHVGLRQGGVFLTQERFTLTNQPHINYDIPITYTTSINPNFDDVQPEIIMSATMPVNMVLDEEDWVLFNIQGQGYYRVNYDNDLWERIIEALEDPDRREVIHPLNRATLVDDALNLARAGRIDYEIAFRVVLSMEHETEYAVWKAFVRNMDFLRKRLVAMVTEDDDLDPDIYLRMVRRTVGAVEAKLSFNPDPLLTEPSLDSLTRGLVMDHACRANYQPCIAAAVDLFYDPNNNNAVNPNIPYDIRPAVYCTMVREGDDRVIEALNERLEVEPSHYERVVILEALGCSRDDGYIRGLLEETITPGNRFGVEERVKIFKSITESSLENAWTAVNFISRRSMEIQNMYGGLRKLEELIFVLADNMADMMLSTDFSIWINAQNNNLFESQMIANRALDLVNENLDWDGRFLQYVYEWIDENDAPTLAVSLVLVGITFMLTIFNH